MFRGINAVVNRKSTHNFLSTRPRPTTDTDHTLYQSIGEGIRNISAMNSFAPSVTLFEIFSQNHSFSQNMKKDRRPAVSFRLIGENG